uniref:Uncharacterized protein n=1 Tax=Anguilla anguilla TaxID=7936 RepID=A0A0E9UP32_ANGAN
MLYVYCQLAVHFLQNYIYLIFCKLALTVKLVLTIFLISHS